MTAKAALRVMENKFGYMADTKGMDFISRFKEYVREQAAIFASQAACVSQDNKFVSDTVMAAATEQ